MPRWLTDENVPRQIIGLLRDRGFDTADIREIGRAGAHDGEVFALAQRENRILITTGRDFSNIILYPPAFHRASSFLGWPNQPAVASQLCSHNSWTALMSKSSHTSLR